MGSRLFGSEWTDRSDETSAMLGIYCEVNAGLQPVGGLRVEAFGRLDSLGAANGNFGPAAYSIDFSNLSYGGKAGWAF